MIIPGLILIWAVIMSVAAAFAGAFMLRKSKAEEIEELWREM